MIMAVLDVAVLEAAIPDMCYATWQGKSAPHFGRQGGEIDRKFSLGEEDVESAPPARATGVSQGAAVPQPQQHILMWSLSHKQHCLTGSTTLPGLRPMH